MGGVTKSRSMLWGRPGQQLPHPSTPQRNCRPVRERLHTQRNGGTTPPRLPRCSFRKLKKDGKYPEAGVTSRSHFKAKDMGLWDALRPELKRQEGKATQRPELNQQHRPQPHLAPERPPSAGARGETKSLSMQGKGAAVERRRRWPHPGDFMRMSGTW